MSEREDRVGLQHMLDATRHAIAFTEGRQREDLDTDLQLTLALTRLMEIVGEAAKNVSDDERQRHPEVPGVRSQEPGTDSCTRTSTSISTNSGASFPPTFPR